MSLLRSCSDDRPSTTQAENETMATPAHKMPSAATLTKMALLGAHGRHWYTNGVPTVHLVAAKLDVTPKVFADILAIMSPQVQVKRNIKLAALYLKFRNVFVPMFRRGAITTNGIARRMKCLTGVVVSLMHWEDTGEIRGSKTRRFSAAVQGVGSALVLDTWMAKVLGVPQSKLFLVNNWKKAHSRFVKVARQLDWTVAEVQAAIWTHGTETIKDSSGRRAYVEAPTLTALLTSLILDV